MKGIPLDTDVVDDFCLYIKAGNEILSTVTDVDPVMSICSARVSTDSPARTGSQGDIAHCAEVRGSQIDCEVTVLDFNIINPTLRNILIEESVVSLFLEVTGVNAPRKMNGKMFDAKLLNRRNKSMDLRSPLRAHVIRQRPFKLNCCRR